MVQAALHHRGRERALRLFTVDLLLLHAGRRGWKGLRCRLSILAAGEESPSCSIRQPTLGPADIAQDGLLPTPLPNGYGKFAKLYHIGRGSCREIVWKYV